jgi:actin-like ATPase involved in cell morphogenesis
VVDFWPKEETMKHYFWRTWRDVSTMLGAAMKYDTTEQSFEINGRKVASNTPEAQEIEDKIVKLYERLNAAFDEIVAIIQDLRKI